MSDISKVAVVFGVTGQDGSYLSELLLTKGYAVVGVARRSSTPNDERIRHLCGRRGFAVVQGDVTDPFSVYRILSDTAPSEVYNLAAQSHVGTSFKEPSHTWAATGCGALNVLEAIRSLNPKGIRFYQASSSEMYGSRVTHGILDADGKRYEGHVQFPDCLSQGIRPWVYQDENTPMHPNSPYAVAKLAAHHLCRVYRESYGIFACSGILFNHESERRGIDFVTRKIARYVARFAAAKRLDLTPEPLGLGNLQARRDWGFAGDYVEAMWMMLQHKKPDDFVVATGETHSVREFLHAAFDAVGESPETADEAVLTDVTQLRPCEVSYLCGNPRKANKELGWKPKTTFTELVKRMVLYEMKTTH